MADNPIILLHPVREPLDQTAVGALELLARMMLPMDTAERTLFWEGIVADIVSKGLLRGLSPQRAREGVDDWAEGSNPAATLADPRISAAFVIPSLPRIVSKPGTP